MKGLLVSKLEQVQNTVTGLLNKMPQRVSLTCDVWSDSGLKNAYLDATLRRIFLGLRQLHGSHTSALIRRETEKLLQEYGLNMSCAFKIVSDGGSNVVKAFNDIRTIESIVDEHEGEEGTEDPQEDAEEDYQSLDFLIGIAFPLRVNCFAHALQLSSVGIDPLKYWASMMNTDARPIAVFAIKVLAIPATSALIERIFSQAGLATTKHRNRTAFELLNSQLVVYCNLYVDDM
uniref:HAT C-terminal dimerisation domain-containing protein n=1 Tax=Ditylenchus dipsaci TaxID=166011 RepID=A0A915ES43_9BILA